MTNEEWKEVENRLKLLFYTVRLKIDGYEITLALSRVTQYKNAIVIYVNGVVKGEWLLKECEESRRFMRKVTRSCASRKQKESFAKLPKRIQKELNININKTHSYYLADWYSFNCLKRHLIKENESIELIKEVL